MARDTHRRYIESAYDFTCQNNVCLTSQYEQTNIFLIQTSRCRTTSGTQYRGKWILENRSTNTRRQQVRKKIKKRKEVINTHNETTTQQVPRNQTEDTNDAAPSSPAFSNLTTDTGDNPYIRRPQPIERVQIFPQDHRLQLSDITRGK